MPLVTIIYVITNIAYFAVLDTDTILSSDAVAVSKNVYSTIQWVENQFNRISRDK